MPQTGRPHLFQSDNLPENTLRNWLTTLLHKITLSTYTTLRTVARKSLDPKYYDNKTGCTGVIVKTQTFGNRTKQRYNYSKMNFVS